MKREPFPLNRWFPMAKSFTLRCCKCGMAHRWKIRVRKDRNIEGMVADKKP
jgi:hypothetical protein